MLTPMARGLLRDTSGFGGRRTLLLCNPMPIVRILMTSNLPDLRGWRSVRPFVAAVRLTERCNSKCPSCNFHRTPKRDELSESAWRNLIDQLQAGGIRQVRFTGGEPLLNGSCIELMKYAAQRGLLVSLQTNASLVTDEHIAAFKAIRIRRISLSLDGVEEDYEKTRGTPWFNRIREVCARLASEFTGVAFLTPTITRDSMPSLESLMGWAQEIKLPVAGFNLVNFNHYFFANDHNKRQYGAMTQEEVATFFRRFRKSIRMKPEQLLAAIAYHGNYRLPELPCMTPFAQVCVGATGDVFPCCSYPAVGNLLHESFETLMSSPQTERIRQAALSKTCPGCSCGLLLSARANIPFSVRARIRALAGTL